MRARIDDVIRDGSAVVVCRAVAAAAGYTKAEAIIAAGAVNLLGSGDKSGPYFNNPRNMRFINMGYDAYKAGLIGRSPT